MCGERVKIENTRIGVVEEFRSVKGLIWVNSPHQPAFLPFAFRGHGDVIGSFPQTLPTASQKNYDLGGVNCGY
jgi:hypothetical protein